MSKKILSKVNTYYSNKIIQNGTTPQGVDWNSKETQELRFEVLSQIINPSDSFSILDYGCGYGSMFEYFKSKYSNFKFTGFDISEEMIEAAVNKFGFDKTTTWITKFDNSKTFDFTIASGIFNVKLDTNNQDWINYILETLTAINKLSKKGFSFNVLTKYSDKEFLKDYLFYADPLILFDFCKKNFSKNVALLHDYNLYEFTILVRK